MSGQFIVQGGAYSWDEIPGNISVLDQLNGETINYEKREQDATYAMAIRALNKAAYAAVRAGGDTTLLPDIDRHSLRMICGETDRLVDHETNSGLSDGRIRENTLSKEAPNE